MSVQALTPVPTGAGRNLLACSNCCSFESALPSCSALTSMTPAAGIAVRSHYLRSCHHSIQCLLLHLQRLTGSWLEPQNALRAALLCRRIDLPTKSGARAGAQQRCRQARAFKQHMQCTWCSSCTPCVSTPQGFWQNNRHAQFDGSGESCRPVYASTHPADDARDDANSARRRWPTEYLAW